MNGRSAKILISVLCGAMLLIAGCSTPAPSGGTPTIAPRTTQGPASATDLGSVTSLLQTMNDHLSLIEENTRPEGAGVITGNMVLFDNQGDTGNTINNGTAFIALPQGRCDVALYAAGIETFTTMWEAKDYVTSALTRNQQTCLDTVVCRRTITLDKEFSYLLITYKPYSDAFRLSRVTLSYRCP